MSFCIVFRSPFPRISYAQNCIALITNYTACDEVMMPAASSLLPLRCRTTCTTGMKANTIIIKPTRENRTENHITHGTRCTVPHRCRRRSHFVRSTRSPSNDSVRSRSASGNSLAPLRPHLKPSARCVRRVRGCCPFPRPTAGLSLFGPHGSFDAD